MIASVSKGDLGLAATTVKCTHCSQLVIGSKIEDQNGDVFCCQGCCAIHGWLHTAKMDGYYDLMAQSGKQAPQAFIGEDYKAFLKSLHEPATLQEIGRWKANHHDIVLECSEITCAGCGWLLERLLQNEKGVKTFDVDFIHGEAYLEYDRTQSSLPEILSIPANFGYRLKPKNQNTPTRPLPDRALLYRLAVSGACFANAMAFSLAIYVDAFSGMSPLWLKAFGLFGFCLTLPAVGYASFPFFSGAWSALKGGRFNIDVTVSIGILLSFIVTTFSLGNPAGKNFSDSLTGLIFFLLLGRWTVRRFEAGLALKGRWFEALRPGKVRVRRNGKTEWVDSDSVKVGDILELLGGEYAPMDGTLEGTEAWMDTSLLTGESRAQKFKAGDPIFAGFLNVKNRIALKTTGNAASTRIAGLGKQLDDLVRGRKSIPDGVGKVAKWFTLTVIACGLITLAYQWSTGPAHAFAAAASVFIISCSCALALAAPISRGLGLKRALNLGFHFRAQTSLEALKEIRCVLFDKTGTLTFTRRMVSRWTWIEIGEVEQGTILAALKTLTSRSLHPVSISLFQALESAADADWSLTHIQEYEHFGLLGRFSKSDDFQKSPKEGPEATLELCICKYGAWEEKGGPFENLGYNKPIVLDSNSGQIVDSCIFKNGKLIALVRFTDEIKPDVVELVQGLKEIGIMPVLLSGDNKTKVDAFAQAAGFDNYHASLSPEEKRHWAIEYRKQYGSCLAVGDGFNDNLLFGESAMAMAMQGGAVDLSKATDILFTGTRPSDLTRLFVLAKRVKLSIWISFWVSGIYNVIAISMAMKGGVSPLFAAVLMPISSLSLCLVAWLVIHSGKK